MTFTERNGFLLNFSGIFDKVVNVESYGKPPNIFLAVVWVNSNEQLQISCPDRSVPDPYNPKRDARGRPSGHVRQSPDRGSLPVQRRPGGAWGTKHEV